MYQLKCRDAGFDCPGIVQGATHADVLAQAGQHAQQAHGVTLNEAQVQQIATLIQRADPDRTAR
ncbi:MAG: DUF1059 domain-containing protein [Burkholderiaceae bacterium]